MQAVTKVETDKQLNVDELAHVSAVLSDMRYQLSNLQNRVLDKGDACAFIEFAKSDLSQAEYALDLVGKMLAGE